MLLVLVKGVLLRLDPFGPLSVTLPASSEMPEPPAETPPVDTTCDTVQAFDAMPPSVYWLAPENSKPVYFRNWPLAASIFKLVPWTVSENCESVNAPTV